MLYLVHYMTDETWEFTRNVSVEEYSVLHFLHDSVHCWNILINYHTIKPATTQMALIQNDSLNYNSEQQENTLALI